ncbi:MAG: aminodeoxychorismate lyase [Gammaproteobacteria bacterium]|nr:aminodeoxychorismate lyase [Gammaproteobacteria bacterium]
MTVAVLVNGHRPSDLAQALPVNDRGFQYGDGVFETMRFERGTVRFLDAHLQRLREGCERLGIPVPDSATLRAEIATVTANLHSAVLKIIVSRGSGARGYRPSGEPVPTRVVAAYSAPENDTQRMLRLRWCETRLGRNERLAGIKHLNRLEQVLAQAEWNDPAIDEGLMMDTEGELVCATSSNVFIFRDGALLTPDLRYAGVRGVMRGQVLRIAKQLGMAVREEPLWPHDLDSAEEVFLTNAVRGIRAVGSLEAKQWTRRVVSDQLRAALGV